MQCLYLLTRIVDLLLNNSDSYFRIYKKHVKILLEKNGFVESVARKFGFINVLTHYVETENSLTSIDRLQLYVQLIQWPAGKDFYVCFLFVVVFLHFCQKNHYLHNFLQFLLQC